MTGVDSVVTTIEQVLNLLHQINPKRSAVVTVENHSSQLLWRVGGANQHGNFVSLPADSIPAGKSDSFAVADADNSFMTGAEGWLKYNAGGMGQAEWTVHWDLPAVGANSADHKLEGAEAGKYAATEIFAGGHDKVPFRFTLTGGPAVKPPGGEHPQPGGEHPQPGGEHPQPGGEHPQPGGEHPQPGGEHPQPGGEHPQPHTPEPEYVPPAQHDEPTLRHGDKSADGWVEYLQERLNHLHYGTLAVDGDFGNGTYHAVIKFQTDRHLMTDGTVGNQTWAALRDETPRDPGTDGRAPHSYTEQGAEARWLTVDEAAHYESGFDMLVVNAVNTGNTPITGGQFHATCRITTEHGQPHTAYLESYTDDGQPAQPGHYLRFGLRDVRTLVGEGQHTLEAYLPDELGGDQTHTSFTVAAH